MTLRPTFLHQKPANRPKRPPEAEFSHLLTRFFLTFPARPCSGAASALNSGAVDRLSDREGEYVPLIGCSGTPFPGEIYD